MPSAGKRGLANAECGQVGTQGSEVVSGCHARSLAAQPTSARVQQGCNEGSAYCVREGEFTWESWARRSKDVAVTEAGRPVLAWAVDVVRDLFGETWLADNAAASGLVPFLSLDRWPLTSPSAVVRLLEVAARAALVGRQPGASALLGQAQQVHPTREAAAQQFIHFCLVLEAAAFAASDGWSVAYEQALPSGRTPDLWLRRNGLDYLVEITVVSLDREFRRSQAWSESLWHGIRELEERYRVEVFRRMDEILDKDATAQWLTDIEAGCRLTARDERTRTVTHGANTAEIFPEGQRPGTTVSEGPPLAADLCKRVEARLGSKARQTVGGPPAWIRIDDIGTMFHLTDWSARPLPQRLADLAHNIGIALADAPHVHGVVLTGGDRLAPAAVAAETAYTGPELEHGAPLASAMPPREALAQGPVVLRRALPGRRQRMTFVIPTRHPHVVLPSGTGLEPGLWYDRETAWLDRTLQELGHPPLAAVIAS